MDRGVYIFRFMAIFAICDLFRRSFAAISTASDSSWQALAMRDLESQQPLARGTKGLFFYFFIARYISPHFPLISCTLEYKSSLAKIQAPDISVPASPIMRTDYSSLFILSSLCGLTVSQGNPLVPVAAFAGTDW